MTFPSAVRWEARRGFTVTLAAYLVGQSFGRPELLGLPLALAQLPALWLAWKDHAFAPGLLAIAATLQCALTFPRTANHAFLAAAAALLLAVQSREDSGEHRWQLGALPALALGWSGVEKLVHGLWFEGQTLAWLAANRDDVGLVLAPLLDAQTSNALSQVNPAEAGPGRYALGGSWVLLSNAVWVLELASPLVWLRPIRAHAWWLLGSFAWSFQWIAHEWEFALLLSALALAAAPPSAQRVGRPLVVVGLLTLTALRVSGAGGLWVP